MEPVSHPGWRRALPAFERRSFSLLAASLIALCAGCAVSLESPGTPGGVTRKRAEVDYSDPVLNQRRIFVFGSITETVAEEVIRKLYYLDGVSGEPITLYLLTPGGELKASFAIVEVMQALRSRVNTVGMAECNSGGAVLLAAGTGERSAHRGSIIVVHGMKVHGSPPPDFVRAVQVTYTGFWKRHARLPAAWLPLVPDKTYVLTAAQALEYGLVDRVVDP
ncbi:MAG: ATP-dependent Clp protease proteolytic subunit [Verrucomicrobiales bacterium]|nr:ATP-dependent Clp protease proteolytic subunit [Verrucomicrobiales bacterium]